MSPASIYEHACGVRTTSLGWPLPGEGETPIGRWNVGDPKLLIDMIADPDFGAYIIEGELGVLVTDKALIGSFYDGKGPVGKLQLGRHVFSFHWPYSLMAEPIASFYRDDPRLHLIIQDSGGDSHLGMRAAHKPRSNREDDFLSPVFAVKNRIDELAEEIAHARAQYVGSAL
jgi:hypothetical protein